MDAGFDRDNVLILSPDVESAGYKGARVADFYRQLLDRIEQLPGVRSASGSLIAPVDGASITLTARVEGYTPRPDEDKEVYVNRVMPKYFETLGTPLLAGRDLNQQDGEGAPKVAIINDTMARYYFRGGNPIGRHVVLGAQDSPPSPRLDRPR